jgi:glycosyltransferase involved in cell wall biosynthesis
MPSLAGGGAERVMIGIANELARRGYDVDLIVSYAKGEYHSEIHRSVNFIDFKVNRVLKAIPKLIQYVKEEKPQVILSTIWHANIIAILVKLLTGSPGKVVIRETNHISKSKQSLSPLLSRLMCPIINLFYPFADVIIAPSNGVADDLSKLGRIQRKKIKVIYNPISLEGITTQAQEKLCHPWLVDKTEPVFIAVGSLTAQKDFSNLLESFCLVNKQMASRLIVLGEGPLRQELKTQVLELGIHEKVDFYGFAKNPFSFMALSDVFVLSSKWEGLPNALIQAVALGMRIVATDCPSGPQEILDNGKIGTLVEVGNVKTLASAMLSSLETQHNSGYVKSSAKRFSSDIILPKYIKVLVK